MDSTPLPGPSREGRSVEISPESEARRGRGIRSSTGSTEWKTPPRWATAVDKYRRWRQETRDGRWGGRWRGNARVSCVVGVLTGGPCAVGSRVGVGEQVHAVSPHL